MVKTYENVNISAEYQWFCMKPSEEDFICLAGEGWQMGLSPSTSPADYQKLNIIAKMSISFFWLERGGRWG